MPPSDCGDTLLHTISRSQPSSCMTSNLRSARSKARPRCGSGMPSKSRNGWNVAIFRPRSATSLATCVGVPLYDSRSLSKISTPRNPAAAIACSFSLKPPLRQTVAIEVFMGPALYFPALFLEELIGRIARSMRLAHRRFQPGDFLLKERDSLGQILGRHQINILSDLVRNFFLRLVVFVHRGHGLSPQRT